MKPPAADGAAAAGAGAGAAAGWVLAGGGADRRAGAAAVDAERRCGGAARRRGGEGLDERRPIFMEVGNAHGYTSTHKQRKHLANRDARTAVRVGNIVRTNVLPTTWIIVECITSIIRGYQKHTHLDIYTSEQYLWQRQ